MQESQKWLRHFSKLTVFSTLCLIFIGALVKSHEVGLSVPDWPTTYGYNMFTFPLDEMVGGVFYEHSHRLFASFVGMLTIILAIWIQIIEKRMWLKKIGFIALGLVIIQGLFGGLTVIFFLPTAISMIHGVIAQTFLLLLIFIAFCLSNEYFNGFSNYPSKNNQLISKWSILMLSVVFIQLILGAWMRHINAGLAIPDFPTVGWSWLPIINENTLHKINDWRFENDFPIISLGPVIVHLVHRIWAGVVLLTIFIFGYQYFRGNREFNPTVFFLHLGVIFQILLGAITVWSGKDPLITSLHVANGAILLGLSFLTVLRYSIKMTQLRNISIEAK